MFSNKNSQTQKKINPQVQGQGQNQASLSSSPLPSSYEFFWGDGCPHCKNVDDFLGGWDKKDKITIDSKEVWNNQGNANLMNQRVAYCNLDPKKVGVPFLFTPEGQCIIGDTPIIDYFKGLSL